LTTTPSRTSPLRSCFFPLHIPPSPRDFGRIVPVLTNLPSSEPRDIGKTPSLLTNPLPNRQPFYRKWQNRALMTNSPPKPLLYRRESRLSLSSCSWNPAKNLTIPPIQMSSISSRALLASNPVERREGLRIPRELAALSAKPNSLCSQNAPLLLGPLVDPHPRYWQNPRLAAQHPQNSEN
jgi:hypothetical protein